MSPGSGDDLLLLDSTPVECGRSRVTAQRSQLAEICGYGYSRSHAHWFWGCRLHLACAPDGTPRAVALVTAPNARWRSPSCRGRSEAVRR